MQCRKSANNNGCKDGYGPGLTVLLRLRVFILVLAVGSRTRETLRTVDIQWRYRQILNICMYTK